MCFCTPEIRTPFCTNCNQHMFLRIAELRNRIAELEQVIKSHGIPVKTAAGGESHYVMGEKE